MKNGLRLLGLFAFLAVLPSARAADVTGTWKGAFDFQGTSVPLTFHLTAAGGAVTGTIEGLPTGAAEIHDGKVDGDAVTFWVNTDYEGTTYKIVYKGKISEGQIEFSFGTEDGSWGASMIVKNSDAPAMKPAAAAAPDVAGNWKGAFDFQGTSVPLTFHLTVAAGVVTGTVEGLPTTPAEIHDGKVEGDTVTFSVTTDYQGTPVKLVYKGKVAADGIKFSFGTEDGSWGTELTAVKAS
jgi:hypothetical protein